LLWEQAVGTAARTRHLLRELEPRGDAETAMLAGLLQPIGAIALATAHPDRYERALRRSIVDDRPLDAAERETFGVDGAALTRQLLHAWHLPSLASARDAVGERRGAALDWAAHVSLAANPAWQRLATEVGTPVTWLAARIAETTPTLGLDDAHAATIAVASAAAVEELRRVLAMPA
jgi:HD-like signal output (HDOD) protein